eukprot:scaffold24130_cov142-Cylindrotheca_fusiformis.AAC.4
MNSSKTSGRRLLACLGLVFLTVSYALLSAFLSVQTHTEEASSNAIVARLNEFSDAAAASTATTTDQLDHCLFRNSTLYRSIFVYPSPGEPEWKGDILSVEGKVNVSSFPWQEIDRRTKANERFHYRFRDFRGTQYSTELLVREIITNPNSCLRSKDPETATLFYVPYLPSMEFHNGNLFPKSLQTSPYSQAIVNAIDRRDYSEWKRLFGVTDKYWKRRNGSDHILVFSEPCHGLNHLQAARGNVVYIQSQKQLAPPIVISVELSQTFATNYPMCTKKNIVMPYPMTDGRWYNGHVDEKAKDIAANLSLHELPVKWENDPNRPIPMYYSAGSHGTCLILRESLQEAFDCSPTMKYVKPKIRLLPGGKYQFPHAYRHATFCPCPGGDTPSAKRFFDVILAGCVPVVLSHDFIWPFTKEIPGSIVEQSLKPEDFSIRLNASDFEIQHPCDNYDRTLLKYLEGIPTKEIERLRRGVRKMAQLYSYYQESPTLPSNLLKENVLPNGGAAFALVEALEERANGNRWPACEEELKQKTSQDTVISFQC